MSSVVRPRRSPDSDRIPSSLSNLENVHTMVLVVLCSVAVVLASAVLWLVRDARRKARGCDAFFHELRAAGSPETAWTASDDRQVMDLLETGDR